MRGRRWWTIFHVLVAAVWVAATAFGMYRLAEYGNTAAAPASPDGIWPENSTLGRLPGLPTLVLAAHPQCPCTRASLGELAIIAARAVGRIDIVVVFLEAPEFDLKSDLWDKAGLIPGARVVADRGGLEIERFGLAASGHAALYSAAGAMVFNGGITGSRGHEGDNLGRSAIVDYALRGENAALTTPVFGCGFGILNPAETAGSR